MEGTNAMRLVNPTDGLLTIKIFKFVITGLDSQLTEVVERALPCNCTQPTNPFVHEVLVTH